jgi:hypothetical protein
VSVVLAAVVTTALIAVLSTQVFLQAGAVTPPWGRTLSWGVQPLFVLFAVVVWIRLSPYL